jgi:hypothetical protein
MNFNDDHFRSFVATRPETLKNIQSRCEKADAWDWHIPFESLMKALFKTENCTDPTNITPEYARLMMNEFDLCGLLFLGSSAFQVDPCGIYLVKQLLGLTSVTECLMSGRRPGHHTNITIDDGTWNRIYRSIRLYRMGGVNITSFEDISMWTLAMGMGMDAYKMTLDDFTKKVYPDPHSTRTVITNYQKLLSILGYVEVLLLLTRAAYFPRIVKSAPVAKLGLSVDILKMLPQYLCPFRRVLIEPPIVVLHAVRDAKGETFDFTFDSIIPSTSNGHQKQVEKSSFKGRRKSALRGTRGFIAKRKPSGLGLFSCCRPSTDFVQETCVVGYLDGDDDL